MSPFDYLNDIMLGKKNISDDTFQKDYVPFLINRGLSYQSDCILFANEMNIRPQVDKNQQYLFLLNTVRAKKRSFAKWGKPVSNSTVNLIKSYFGYSDARALEVIDLITDDDIEQLKQLTNAGGVK